MKPVKLAAMGGTACFNVPALAVPVTLKLELVYVKLEKWGRIATLVARRVGGASTVRKAVTVCTHLAVTV